MENVPNVCDVGIQKKIWASGKTSVKPKCKFEILINTMYICKTVLWLIKGNVASLNFLGATMIL